MAKGGTILVIALVAIGAFLLMNGGSFNLGNLFSSGNGQVDAGYPSDLKTTVTLNTGDKLATSATAANISYYVFDAKDGKFLKEGTTSAGTASFTVPTAGNYKVIAYDDSSTTAEVDYLPITVEFSTDGDTPTGRAIQTVNADLLRESNITIKSVIDPVDLDGNISLSAGGTASFDVKIQTERSYAAIYKPVIRVQGNASCIDEIKFSSLQKVDCPDRLQESTNFKQYCYQDSRTITTSEGLQVYTGTVIGDTATACPSAAGATVQNQIQVQVLDTQMYIEPDYKTKGISAFKEGTENPISNADVGVGDMTSINLGTGG